MAAARTTHEGVDTQAQAQAPTTSQPTPDVEERPNEAESSVAEPPGPPKLRQVEVNARVVGPPPELTDAAWPLKAIAQTPLAPDGYAVVEGGLVVRVVLVETTDVAPPGQVLLLSRQ